MELKGLFTKSSIIGLLGLHTKQPDFSLTAGWNLSTGESNFFFCCSLLSSLVWVDRHTLLNVGAIPPKGLIARLTIRKGIRWPGFLGEQPLR